MEPGERLEARYCFRLERDRFLADHTLGREVAVTDPDLHGLPVVPFTISIEILAEAGSTLLPERVLVRMEEVRTYRWIALNQDEVSIDIWAQKRDSDHIEARITDSDTGSKIVEATLHYGDRRPDPPVRSNLGSEGGPSRWSADQLYSEVMFHGPAFRGVETIDVSGKRGAQARVRVLPGDHLFDDVESPNFITDPVLLDQPGQLVGFWTAEHLERAYVIFPYRVGSLEFFDLQPDSIVQCDAEVELLGEWGVRSNLEVSRHGRLCFRFSEWEDRRFDLPESFFRLMMDPSSAALSQKLPLFESVLPSTFRIQRVGTSDFPAELLSAHGGIWLDVLAYLILGRKERRFWGGLNGGERRRREWLLGRLAAKEALCSLLEEEYDIQLRPADIEILPDAAGKPTLSGRWLEWIDQVPLLSISHSGDEAVAIVGPARHGDEILLGVGIDREPIERMNERIAQVAFSEREKALLTTRAPEDEWRTKLWCAKEAVGKALGSGVVGGPQAIEVVAIHLDSGRFDLILHEPLASQFGEVEKVDAHTARLDGAAFALTVLKKSAIAS